MPSTSKPSSSPGAPSPESGSSSASTVKNPSPLNPAAPAHPPPPPHTLSSPASVRSVPLPSTSTQSVRSRGASVSTIRGPSLAPTSSLLITRVVSSPPSQPHSLASSTTTLGGPDFRSRSVTRSRASSTAHRGRSISPLRDLSFIWRRSEHGHGDETPPYGESTSWWTSREIIPRPWDEKGERKRQKTVPVEQTEGYMRTRQKVSEAAINVLGTASNVAHELLEISVDVLRFAPIVGLEEAARTLLNIWDSLQLVDINRLACLRLTERCATVLMSIREEIAEARSSGR